MATEDTGEPVWNDTKDSMQFKKKQFIKYVLFIMVLTFTVYWNMPTYSFGRSDRDKYLSVILILVCLSVRWLFDDVFCNKYQMGSGFYVLHFLIVVITCTIVAFFFISFENDFALLNAIWDWGMYRHYLGGLTIWFAFFWIEFFAAAAVSVYALWAAAVKSKVYYSIVCHGLGAMELIVIIRRTVDCLDLEGNYEADLHNGVAYGLFIYLVGIILAALYWWLCRKNSKTESSDNRMTDIRVFSSRATGMILILLLLSRHLWIYWFKLGRIVHIEDMNICGIMMETALLILSIWLVFKNTFYEKCEWGPKLFIFHAITGLLSFLFISSVYLLCAHDFTLYHAMEDRWGNLLNVGIMLIYFACLMMAVLISGYSLFASYRRSISYFSLLCHGVCTLKMILFIMYMYFELICWNDDEALIHGLIFSVIIYLEGIILAVIYKQFCPIEKSCKMKSKDIEKHINHRGE